MSDDVLVYYYYNGTWYYWSSLLPPELCTLTELHAGMAVYVWYDGEEPVTIRLWGLWVNITYRLAPGWNMIAVADYMDPAQLLPDVEWTWLLTYDPATGTWKYYHKRLGIGTLEVLAPGQGYWIYVEG